MTIGERIAQIRKEQGLSQEAFGELLGVSRQSISKWEANQSVPEVEKLITMHKLYGVSVGWLLGTEDERDNDRELTEDQLKMVDQIVQKYIESIPRPEPQTKKYTKVWLLTAIIFMLAFIINMINTYNRFNSLDNQQRNLEYSIDRIRSSVDSEVESIGKRVEEIIQKQNSILASYETKRCTVDLRSGTLQMELSATPKTYVPGMTLDFVVDDGTQIITISGVEGENRLFTATAECVLTDEIDVSVVLHSNGTEQTQLIESWSYLFSETKLNTDTWFWESELWARYLPEFENRSIPLNTFIKPDELNIQSKDGEKYVVTANAIEHLVYVNEELVQTVKTSSGVSEFKINGMDSSEYVEKEGFAPFCGFLNAHFISKLQNGDEVDILTIVTDNYDRRYIASAIAYVVEDHGNSKFLEFADFDMGSIKIDGIIDSLVKF